MLHSPKKFLVHVDIFDSFMERLAAPELSKIKCLVGSAELQDALFAPETVKAPTIDDCLLTSDFQTHTGTYSLLAEVITARLTVQLVP